MTKEQFEKRGALLSVEGVSKHFDIHSLEKHITGCQGISLDLFSGEFVGITGKSGSGKSTILKLIYRSYLPQSGSAWYQSEAFGAMDLFNADERTVLHLRRHEIGYVSQFLHVIPRTSARTIVEQAIVEKGTVVETEELRHRAETMLAHFDLSPELWDSYPSTFSGGEKLRLNIARAMVTEPRLMLLDEPTASLDKASKEKVRQLLIQMKGKGTTMVGIFHDLEFMEGLCDREYSMAQGIMA